MDALTEVPVGPVPPSSADDPGRRPRSSWWRRLGLSIRPHVVALLGFAGVTCAVYWPIVLHPRSRILADGGDGALYLWNMWWFPRAVLHGHNPFHTGAVFHPLGANLGFNTILAPVSLASWPVQKLFGLAVAANAV